MKKQLTEIKIDPTMMARVALGGLAGGAIATPLTYAVQAGQLRMRIAKLRKDVGECPDIDCVYRTRAHMAALEDELSELSSTSSTVKNTIIGAIAGAAGGATTGWLGKREPNSGESDVKPDIEIKESVYIKKTTKYLCEIGAAMAPWTATSAAVGGALGAGAAGVGYLMKRRKLMQQLAMCTTDDCKASIRNQLNSLGAGSLATAAIGGAAGAAAGYGLGQSGAVDAGVKAYQGGNSVVDSVKAGASTAFNAIPQVQKAKMDAQLDGANIAGSGNKYAEPYLQQMNSNKANYDQFMNDYKKGDAALNQANYDKAMGQMA